MPALAIREDRSPEALRCLAKVERDVRVARRLECTARLPNCFPSSRASGSSNVSDSASSSAARLVR